MTRVNVQVCETCHRLFIITYERKPKGKLIETGHELETRIKLSGVVRAQDPDGQTEPYIDSVTGKNREVSRRRLLVTFRS